MPPGKPRFLVQADCWLPFDGVFADEVRESLASQRVAALLGPYGRRHNGVDADRTSTFGSAAPDRAACPVAVASGGQA